jgi:hypothetical protein
MVTNISGASFSSDFRAFLHAYRDEGLVAYTALQVLAEVYPLQGGFAIGETSHFWRSLSQERKAA